MTSTRTNEAAMTATSSTTKRVVTDVARAYDAWSAVYDGDQNPLVALDDVITPHLFFSGSRGGELRILDAGCGTGRHSVRLAAHAHAHAHVTGIDASKGMLARAIDRVAPQDRHRFTFFVHDLREALPFVDATFDLVVCTLVLEHAPSLREPIGELARVTKRGGRIVVSDIHPAMRATGTQANFTDPATGEDVLPPSHQHTVAAYLDAARAAGLHVDTILEHDGTPRLVERTPRARKYLGKPMLLAFRLTR